MITAFPKIFTLGTSYVKDIFNEEVEISEKIDGSQFAFGRIDGKVVLRSKGREMFLESHDRMFLEACMFVNSNSHLFPDGIIFYTEYLKKPKHNTLKYNRIPKNHLMLFAMMHISQTFKSNLSEYADLLGIECVPIIYKGKIDNLSELTGLLSRDSVLGGVKIEGVVAKNYERSFLLGGQPIPIMAGKYVSESFKEVNRERWGAEEKTASRMEVFKESFRTEARWQKAIQHLEERGVLNHEPSDIGKLIKEIQADIEAEEKENIKYFLWNEFKGEIMRKATWGAPEWYKKKLMESSFAEE